MIKFFKVQWSNHTEDEATWEREDFLQAEYPYLFEDQQNLEDEIFPKGVGVVTPKILIGFFKKDFYFA